MVSNLLYIFFQLIFVPVSLLSVRHVSYNVNCSVIFQSIGLLTQEAFFEKQINLFEINGFSAQDSKDVRFRFLRFWDLVPLFHTRIELCLIACCGDRVRPLISAVLSSFCESVRDG